MAGFGASLWPCWNVESRIGAAVSAISHNELWNAQCFQELVSTRRRIVEGAGVVAVISSGMKTDELVHRLCTYYELSDSVPVTGHRARRGFV